MKVIIIDTNIIFSATLNPKSSIGEVLFNNAGQFQVYKRISFISDEQIPIPFWASSAVLVWDIDMDDLPFVALAKYLDGDLWTGDMELLNGLKAKGFLRCVTTQELLQMIDRQ